MIRPRFGAVAAVTVLAALLQIGAARANEDCAQMFDRFAAEMDSIADSYEKMKTQTEICEFMRSKDIPTHKRIVAWVEANYTKCKTGTKALQFARNSLRESVAREKQKCH